MIDTSQLERLKKLNTLTERGTGGEKENAGILLKKLCNKYHILPEQIESDDERKMRWFKHKRGKIFQKLLCQCIYKTLGKDHTSYTHGKTSEIGTECTIAEGIEIELDYEYYSKILESEIKRLVEMFIQKNDIFPPSGKAHDNNDKSGKELTKEDILLYQAIKKQTRTLQISGGK